MNGLQALIIASTIFASLTASAGVLNRLSGTWDTMPIDKPTCESDEYQHTMVVSPHKDRVTIKHAKAIDGPNGKIQEYTYKVLYCVFRGIVTADFGIVTGHSGAS